MSTVIYPMPNIAEGLPSYTNDDFSSGFPASWGNDATFGGSHAWRCQTTPIGNANSGPLTQTVWWVVDLSSVPLSQRQLVIFYWQNNAVTGAYAPTLISNNPNNLLRDYTVQINFGAGGSPPSNGWQTVATVSGNTLHSKQHLVNMSGANWIGVYITGVYGSTSNNNAQGKFKVFDAHLGAWDSWFIAGDSITQRGSMDDEGNGFGQIIPKQIHGTYPGFYPLWEDAGMGGWTATDYQPNFAGWIANFPGKFVCLNLGTNDANLGGSYVANYQSMMQSMITTALNAGLVVVIPTIPWINTTAQALTNVNTLNGVISTLISSNPGCIAGPDLYTFFSTHQSDISSDGIHPTDPALSQGSGYPDYKTQWVNWATSNIYHNILNTSAQSKFKTRTVLNSSARTSFKVRTALKTTARSSFKVQLSNTGPKPYAVTGVITKIQARPFSTVTSQALVADQNNVLQDGLTATVTVTFPDGSTATPGVYGLGGGQYSITYNMKGPGTVTELWVFTDGRGSQIEAQHTITCSY